MLTKSLLACSIDLALGGPIRVRQGPVSPYQSHLNRMAYYHLLGHGVWSGRSAGKTQFINLPELLPHQRIAHETTLFRNRLNG